MGDLAEVAIAQEIGARITHVDDRDPRAISVGEPVEPRHGRAHTGEFGAVRDDESDGGARTLHGLRKACERLSLAEISIGDLRECGDGGGAGQLAAGMAAHAVSDDEQSRRGVPGVLVALAHLADIGARGVAECERHGHLCNCRVVRPIRSGTPGGRTVGEVMRVRSIQVPLVEPRSSTIQPSSLGYRRACRLDA